MHSNLYFQQELLLDTPKVRSMEIIDELEPESRGPYAGAIGYFLLINHVTLQLQ